MHRAHTHDGTVGALWRSVAQSWETIVVIGIAAGICFSVVSMAARLQVADSGQLYGRDGTPLVTRSVALIDPHDPFRFD